MIPGKSIRFISQAYGSYQLIPAFLIKPFRGEIIFYYIEPDAHTLFFPCHLFRAFACMESEADAVLFCVNSLPYAGLVYKDMENSLVKKRSHA